MFSRRHARKLIAQTAQKRRAFSTVIIPGSQRAPNRDDSAPIKGRTEMSAVSSLLEKQNPLSAFSTASVMMDHAFVAPASTSATAKKKAFTNFQTLVEVLKRRIQPLEPHVEVHSP